MKKQTLLFAMLLFVSFLASAQDVIEYKGEKINALDEQGRKTGIWKVYDDVKGIVIITHFKEGNVVEGPMYYKDSILLAAIIEGRAEVYKEGKAIEVEYYIKPDGTQTLIDSDGNEQDKELYECFSEAVHPMYYGGYTALFEFIGNNFKSIKGQKGKIVLEFVIDKIGRTSEIVIHKSTNPALNDEAKRVISILPRWQPAFQNGAFVRMAFTLPITIN